MIFNLGQWEDEKKNVEIYLNKVNKCREVNWKWRILSHSVGDSDVLSLK